MAIAKWKDMKEVDDSVPIELNYIEVNCIGFSGEITGLYGNRPFPTFLKIWSSRFVKYLG